MTDTTKATRAALYGRVSTSGHGQDVELQLDELRQVARQRGWDVVGEYVDNGVSGGKRSRPALDELMDAVREGRVDVVAVWRFDRAARSVGHLVGLLEEFRQREVEFVSIREAIDTSTATGRMVYTVIAAIAEFEAELVRERVRAGVARAKAQGKRCGRPPRDLDLELARMLMSQGHGLRRTARMLQVPKSTLARHLANAAPVSQ